MRIGRLAGRTPLARKLGLGGARLDDYGRIIEQDRHHAGARSAQPDIAIGCGVLRLSIGELVVDELTDPGAHGIRQKLPIAQAGQVYRIFNTAVGIVA